MNGKLSKTKARLRAMGDDSLTDLTPAQALHFARDMSRMQRHIEHAGLVASTAAKFPKARTHKPKKATPPSWPLSNDQKLQRRPLIVLRPVHALCSGMVKGADNPERRALQKRFHAYPKHTIPEHL